MMSTEKKELHVDRIEDGIAVAYDRFGNEYTLRQKIADIRENDIINATVNEHGHIIDLTVLTKKTEATKLSLKARLKKLFKK